MNLDIKIGSNPLKELSERMKWKVDAFSADEVFADSIANPSDEEERKAASFFNEYVIAQRIIAELAKVVDCKEPERIMPFDEPYDDITLYAPYDNGLTEANSINEDEKRFILDLANAAWKCRAIAEEGVKDGTAC